MEPIDAAHFYTGLVAELYAALRSSDPDVEQCARFIERTGQPALELGCGDGDPLLDLRRRGLNVEGLDSSSDMLERCRRRAAVGGIEVELHHSSIETMDLGRRFRSIFLAGPTFNLILDDDSARSALERIAAHLEPDGAALIPLFVPRVLGPAIIGRSVEKVTDDGALIRCSTMAVRRDDDRRLQAIDLRYERRRDESVETLDRAWMIHWHTPSGFAQLVADAALVVRAVVGNDGRPATDDASEFAFIVGHG